MKGIRIARDIGRATAVSSIVGSSLIIYMILSDRERKLSRPYHRIMLMMSSFDVLQSLSLAISTAACPRQSGISGAKGNELTCTMQGFLLALGLAVPLYNSCLHIYYVLTIRYNISSEQFSKYEYILHMISILFPLSIAVISILYGYIMPRTIMCVPQGKVFLWVTTLTFSICFLVCIVSMVCICWTVLSQATTMAKYTSFKTRKNSVAQRTSVDNDRNKTIKQAFLYGFAFLFTYTFLFAGALYTRGNKGVDHQPYALILLTAIFYPLQGFWNFIFYVRPGVERIMKLNPEKSYIGAIRDAVFIPNSMNMNNRRLVGTRKLPELSSQSNGMVETFDTPDMADVVTPDASIEICTTFSGNETPTSTAVKDLFAIENSVRPLNLHDAFGEKLLGNTTPVNESSEDTIMEHDVEHQSKFQYKTDTLRRLSLPDISSIIDGTYIYPEDEKYEISETDDNVKH